MATLAIALALACGVRAAGAEPDARPVVVIVEGDAGAWSSELRQAIARELRAEAVAPDDPKAQSARGTVTLSLSTANEELVVRYRPIQGNEISRRVRVPEDRARVVRASALLTGNLVRNEAEEILAAARRRGPGTDAASSRDPNAEPPVPGPGDPAEKPVEATETPKEPAPPAPPEVRTLNTEEARARGNAEKPVLVKPPRPCLKLRASAPFHPVVFSLFPPIATNFLAPKTRTPFALNLLYSDVGHIEGADIGVASHVDCDVQGAQVQMAVADAGGEVRGAQVAGLWASTRETVFGIQGALVATRAMRLEGAQFALVDTARDVRGVQFGLVTYARTMDGMQAGLVNVAGDVDGVQLGLVNVGRKVKGLNIGLVTVAEELDGPSLSLFQFAKNGYVRPIAWAGSSTYLNANIGVRFDTRWTYGQISFGYVEGSGFDDVAQSTLFGFHVLKPDEPGFLLDAEIGSQYRIGAKNEEDDKTRGLIHAIAGWRIAKRLAFFAGMGIVYSQRKKDDFVGPDVIAGAIF
ncbi:hypothetical protein LZC95_43860 [Pendulispora brunnea]|uniref:Uncharacterized protein n=1 Tax=Pendulispora brunnea TaxID=2905690 RepID=A0ABZ2K5M5_9BACT